MTVGSAAQAYDFASGDEEGKLHELGSAIAEATAGQTAEDLEPISTDGFVDNARLLREGDAAFALIDSLATYWLVNAEGPFAGGTPFEDLRVVATLWYEVDHFVVGGAAAESGTIADFSGLATGRVSLSDENTTQINANRQILDEFGAGVDVSLDIDALTGPGSVQRLDYAQIGGLAVTAPLPSDAVGDAMEAMPGGGALLGFTSGQFAGLPGSAEGAWMPFVIPANTYPGQGAEIDTTARPVMLVTRADISDENVYQLARSLFSSLPDLAGRSPLAGLIKLENAIDADLPFALHPGAARYFEQIGLITDSDAFERLQANQDPLARRDSTIDPWKAYRPLQSILFTGTPEEQRSRTFVSFFEFNSTTLDEPAEATVEEIAAFASTLDNAEIFVAGHTDRAGSQAINDQIARARAASVVDRLVELGYDPDLISSAGFGEDRPAVSTADEEQHLQNRRVETVVSLPANGTTAVAALDQAAPVEAEPPASEPATSEPAVSEPVASEDEPLAPAVVEAEAEEAPAEVAAVEPATADGLPTLSVDGISGPEGGGGLLSALRLSAPSKLPVVLVVTRLNGTAAAGSDFESTPTVITIRPGETETSLETVLIDDDVAEGDETFELKISGSDNHVDIPDEPIVITIEDDD